jgi:hypothetical protein
MARPSADLYALPLRTSRRGLACQLAWAVLTLAAPLASGCDDGFDPPRGRLEPPPADGGTPPSPEAGVLPAPAIGPAALGCAAGADTDGDRCGACGRWRCAAAGLACDDPGADACGVCTDRPAAGTTCGSCGGAACDAPAGDVVCAPPAGGASCSVFAQALEVDTPPGLDLNLYSSGLAFADVDGDGCVDVAVGASDRVRVFAGDCSGGFAEAPDALAGVAGPSHVAAVTLVDFDGDADFDLFLSAQSPTPGLYLFTNDGAGHFQDASSLIDAPVSYSPGGVAWADYDGDGWLDAFVAGQFGSVLLHNQAGASLADVAAELGIAAPDHVSCQPAWLDYDLDGDPDLFVVNDRGPTLGTPSFLYRNDGGAFTDVAATAGVSDLLYGMGIAAADFDDDGDVDLYATNIGWSPVIGTGQKLYVNAGDGTFVERAHDLGAAAANRFAWGAEFLDYDDDGDLDLAVAALAMATGGGGGPWLGDAWSSGAGFLDVSGVVGALPAENAYGLASADFDSDGRLDVGWTFKADGVAARLYRNVAPAGHWLRVRIAAASPNVHGIGARVLVDAGGVRRTRLIAAGGSFLSSDEPVAHFGLGTVAVIDAIEAHLPDGTTVLLPGPLAADQLVEITP